MDNLVKSPHGATLNAQELQALSQRLLQIIRELQNRNAQELQNIIQRLELVDQELQDISQQLAQLEQEIATENYSASGWRNSAEPSTTAPLIAENDFAPDCENTTEPPTPPAEESPTLSPDISSALPDSRRFVGKLTMAPAILLASSNPFLSLKMALRNNTYRQEFPIGTEIPDPWTDTALGETYQMPWTAVHYGEMRCADDKEHFGAILFRRIAPPIEVEFDAPEPDNSQQMRRHYGNNRYAYSGLAQWQNSHGKAREWFIKQHEYDMPPSIADTKDGYLRGCSTELLSVLAEQQPVLLEVPAQDDSGNQVTDRFIGHIFLPDKDNLFPKIRRSDVCPELWEFFRDPDDDLMLKHRIVRDTSGMANYWYLRSAIRTDESCVRIVWINGRSFCSYASHGGSAAPACVFIYI